MELKRLPVVVAKKAFFASYLFGLERVAERVRFFGISKKRPCLFIEPTNKCNLRCIMCPQRFHKRKRGFMSMELYKKIIDDASILNIEYVKLSPFGEPLLHPNIFEMVKYAKEKGLEEIGFPTNGILLNKEKAKQLLESGIDYVNFSIDSLKPNVYKKIRVGAKLKPVLKNVLFLINLKKQLGYEKPWISVSALDMNHTHDEVEHIKEFWKSKVNEVIIQQCTTFDGFEKLNQREFVKEHACIQPFDRLVIFQDGKCTVCCDDFNGEIIVGDINNESITEIWNGKKFNRIRKIHLQHDFKKIPRCNRCEAIRHEIRDLIPKNAILDRLGKFLQR